MSLTTATYSAVGRAAVGWVVGQSGGQAGRQWSGQAGKRVCGHLRCG